MLVSTCNSSAVLAPFIASFENSTGPMINSYMGMVRDIGEKLAAAPGKIREMHDSFNAKRHLLTWGPLLPVALISLLCLGMVIEAVVVELCDSSSIAFEIDCSLRVATWLFAVVIMIVTLVGSLELFIANGLSLLCNHVDENVVEAVLGEGYNPIEKLIQNADSMIYNIVMEYDGIEKL